MQKSVMNNAELLVNKAKESPWKEHESKSVQAPAPGSD